ncbi:MAG: ABC transporter substrate-binding protein [Bacteroidales bacterium]|nr:ABC transporter substrate-binding protein [Bacteroidales bacterium]
MMLRYCVLVMMGLVLAACAGGDGAKAVDSAEQKQAQLLSMEQCEGYLKATIQNPWNDGRVLHTYLLVPRDSAMPAQLPEGTVVRTPVQNALVYSEVHASLMRELGAFAAVKGVCDANYYTDDEVLAGVKAGTIADCGSSMQPTIEKVIALKPEAILLSPYQDASYGQIEKMNIPIIECADYLEYTPLGRAEWMRFYGALLGKSAQADSLYAAVASRYRAIAEKAATAQQKPTVITEMVISGIWAVPGGNSYMARIIADAGGDYPWASDKSTGSLSLDFNQVLAKAQKADYWLLKWTGINTLADLQAQYDLNKSFDAFRQRKVWACDTEQSHFFVRVPFHPDLLLGEFAAVLHPELFPEAKTEFYHHLK